MIWPFTVAAPDASIANWCSKNKSPSKPTAASTTSSATTVPRKWSPRILHKPEFSSEATLAAFDAVIREVQENGISEDELQQLKVKWRSDYYSTLEGGRGGYMPRYGLMHLLACFTLFDGEPQLVNTILDGFLAVTREDVLAAAKKYLRNDKRAIVFRKPVNAAAKEAA